MHVAIEPGLFSFFCKQIRSGAQPENAAYYKRLEYLRVFAICCAGKLTMHHSNCLTVSERRARLLLSAWNSGDLARLESALNSVSTASNTSLPFGEMERIEMVNEVSTTIQGWIDRCRDQHEL